MSKVVITGNASGTGDFTIAAPNSNTDRTLTLPDEAGTVDTLQRAGNVLQVMTTSSISASSTVSTSYIALSGATLTITPSNTANKILVLWSSTSSNSLVAGANVNYRHAIFRDTTNLYSTLIGVDSGSGGLQIKSPIMFSIVDAPSTTSAVTYNIQHHTSNASSTGTFGGGSLTLMEIAG
jgi:hypothetical protein